MTIKHDGLALCFDEHGREIADVGCYEWDPRVHDHVWKRMRRPVAMVITAPRGRAVIFEDLSSDGRHSGMFEGYQTAGEAVRAFVEQHRGEE